MAAIIHRSKTGEGQFVEVSQAECVTSTIPEIILDYTANKNIPERIGNSHPEISPHGCYPCKGRDKWITIATQSEDEWTSLANLLFPEIAHNTKFDSNASRIINRRELDELISIKTKEWDSLELMEVLQRKGVGAGAVLNGKELLFNKHLFERNFFEIVVLL